MIRLYRTAGRPTVLTTVLIWWCLSCPAASVFAEAPERDETAKATKHATPAAIFHGPAYRYDQAALLERSATDVVAIPAGVVNWSGGGWATFGGLMAGTTALMLPTDPSPDARLDDWIERRFDPWMPDLWQMKYQAFLWGGLAAGGLGSWGYAKVTGNRKLAEAMSLVGESVAVSQVYHLSIKILTGRAGPRMGQGRGIFRGPGGSFDTFPAGTPSGHFATLYAAFGASESYWDFPLAWDVTGHLLMGILASTHVINHRHFLSEIVAGSAMGYAIGQWVVRHRSTRYEYREGRAVRVSVGPARRGISLSIQVAPGGL
jgi:hypothetical protein